MTRTVDHALCATSATQLANRHWHHGNGRDQTGREIDALHPDDDACNGQIRRMRVCRASTMAIVDFPSRQCQCVELKTMEVVANSGVRSGHFLRPMLFWRQRQETNDNSHSQIVFIQASGNDSGIWREMSTPKAVSQSSSRKERRRTVQNCCSQNLPPDAKQSIG